MAAIGSCSECGAPLNHDAPEGFCPACMLQGAIELRAASRLDSPSSSGHRFGDYELLEEIGRGGMGVVYRARQLSLDRIVAVKLILSGAYAGEVSIRRFRAEAAAAAKLHHANIVAIHEVGEQDGQPFFSMDYVAGRDLENHAREHPFTAREAARLIQTIAQAIHHAHAQGVVHRDLKPSNILVDGGFEPHITDFGLAKRLTDSQPSTPNPQLTLSGQVLGSPSFLPPEQASGKRGQVAPATDVYALGAILYFLLTGRPPFVAETITDTLQEVLNTEPVPTRMLNPSVPRDLETICLKCLEKDPIKRYSTAVALAEELGRFLNREPIRAHPLSAPAKVWRWCRRKPVIAGLAGGCAISLLLGFGGVTWQWRRAEQKAFESRRNLYGQDMILAQMYLETGNTGHAKELLRKHLPLKGEKDLRGWEWRYAWNRCRSDELFTLGRQSGSVMTLALSPDGRTLASGGYESVVIWDLASRRPAKTLAHTSKVRGLAFTKDGQQLFVGTTDGVVWCWNRESWKQAPVLSDVSSVLSLRISPDGKTLAILGMQYLTLYDLAERREISRTRLSHGVHFVLTGVAFSPDSSLLAYSKEDGTIGLYDLANTRTIAPLKGHERAVSALMFSPDGSILVSGGVDQTLRVWDVASRRELKRISTFSGWVGCAEFTSDGRLLVVAGADQRIRIFEVEHWEEIAALKGHLDEVWSVVLAPDGKSMMTGSKDGAIKCWAVPTDPLRDWKRLPGESQGLTLLAGARHLYVWQTNGTYSVWRTDPLEEIGRYPRAIPGITASTVSPDGRFWVAATTNRVLKIFDHVERQFLPDVHFRPAGAAIGRLAFSPSGHLLAGAQGLTCGVWAPPTFQEVATIRKHAAAVSTLEISRSGRLLGIGYADGVAEFWDIASGQRVATLPEHEDQVNDIAISHDDTLAATASTDARVKVWDLRNAREVADFGGQLQSCSTVLFSADEKRIVACGGDGTVRFWDIESRQEVATLRIHNFPLRQMAFSGANESLIVLGADPTGGTRIFTLRAPPVADP